MATLTAVAVFNFALAIAMYATLKRSGLVAPAPTVATVI
jgi:hypothetical protein